MMFFRRAALIATAGVMFAASCLADELDWIGVSPDGRGFVQVASQQPFDVWGVNYDHDPQGRLIEDYWHDDWATVEADFAEIKALGANVVRIHLQFGRFMDGPTEPNPAALDKLSELLALAERNGLYLDLTGLGCYHKADVPGWYDALDEQNRWQSQARFWEAVAETCADSPAVFCYDLMNEPVVPGPKRPAGWLGPDFAGKHFVQFVTLELAGRERTEVARRWIAQLVAAIRRHDERHLVTVGLVHWSLDRPGMSSGFVPGKVTDELDFVAMHIYPETGNLDDALETLRGFQIGKPLVVEETFALKCSPDELEEFIEQADGVAGWISFYWGQTAEECRQSDTFVGAITAAWLERFKQLAP